MDDAYYFDSSPPHITSHVSAHSLGGAIDYSYADRPSGLSSRWQPKRMLGEKKVYRCQECKYVTDRKNNLKRHVATMHETCTKVLECCDTVFPNKASLREHVVSCHRNGYDCRICGRNFCRKALLKRHITVHSGQKDYVCSICGYATSHKSNLDRHKKRHAPKQSCSAVRKLSMLLQSYGDVRNKVSLLYNEEYANFLDGKIGEDDIKMDHDEENNNAGKYGFKKRILQDFIGSPKHNREIDISPCDLDHEEMGIETDKCLTESPETFQMALDRTRRRLFPSLHKCRLCNVVFQNQLQLLAHFEYTHGTENALPLRPITVQFRPKQTRRSWMRFLE